MKSSKRLDKVAAQGRTVDETIRLFTQGNKIEDENLDAYVNAVELRKLPPTEAMTKFQKEYQEGGGDCLHFHLH